MYCKCLIEEIEREEKHLINKYIKLFGNKKPYPPFDIMENMIKLKIKKGDL